MYTEDHFVVEKKISSNQMWLILKSGLPKMWRYAMSGLMNNMT